MTQLEIVCDQCCPNMKFYNLNWHLFIFLQKDTQLFNTVIDLQ
jgi:hypothetical protein